MADKSYKDWLKSPMVDTKPVGRSGGGPTTLPTQAGPKKNG